MKTGILLLAYKRFDILNQVIEALNKNKHYDLVVIFDNHDEIDKYNQMKQKIISYFPNAIVKMRQQKYGLDFNVINSLHEMFYMYNFDRVFYIEDDVYCDPTCLETLENLMNWTDKNLPNRVGIVQSWNNNLTNDYYIKLHGLEDLDYSKTCTYKENEIGFTGQNFWGCMISKKCWEAIYMFVFQHLIAIRNNQFNVENFQNEVSKLIKESIASDAVKFRVVDRFYWKSWESSVDLGMVTNNLFKIALTNPRSKTLGDEGVTSDSKMFESSNLYKIQTLNSPNIPTQFILNQQSKKLWLKE